MREIADMGARAVDDLAVGVDQRVGFAHQRRDLDREAAFEPLGAARADRGQALGDALERREAVADLEGRGQQQHDRQHREGHDQRAVEGAHLLVDLGGVAGDRHDEAALVAEIDGALDHAQALLLGPVDIALAGAARRWSWRDRRDAASVESHSEREERSSGRAVSSRVTCQYQPDSGSSNSGSLSDCGNRSTESSGVATSATSVRR